MPKIKELTGRCACGAVSFSATGPFRDGIACHCRTYRQQSGHFIAATAVDLDQLTIEENGALAWYRASAQARRGFCCNCGSFLFWEPDSGSHMAVMLGSVDDPGDIELTRHIYASEKGAYYEIADGLPVKAIE